MYSREGETSLYPVLIAYLASFVRDMENASRALEYARKTVVTPGPALSDYYAGSMTAAEMISCVTNRAEETEAHILYWPEIAFARGRGCRIPPFGLGWPTGDPRVFEYGFYSRYVCATESLVFCARLNVF